MLDVSGTEDEAMAVGVEVSREGGGGAEAGDGALLVEVAVVTRGAGAVGSVVRIEGKLCSGALTVLGVRLLGVGLVLERCGVWRG